MNMPLSSKNRGFTLVELLVVITIIAVLAGIFLPVINIVRRNAHIVDAMASGRGIYQSLQAACIEGENIMPKSAGNNAFASSTDYWKWVVTNEVMDATFDVFSAYGLPSYAGLEQSRFTSAENAWCLVADVTDSTRSMTPVMFTRNLDINNLSDQAVLADVEPFGMFAAVVVMKDGRADKIKSGDLAETFNPADESKVILKP